MCRAVKCRTCGKTTGAGCGKHVEQVMSGVPASQRCSGHPREPRDRGSVFGRIFGTRSAT